MFGPGGVFGGKKPAPRELAKEAKREVGREQRGLEREITNMNREEQKLINEIKRVARSGDEKSAKVLAKNLVQLRKNKERLYGAKVSIGAVGMQATTASTQVAMAGVMQSTSQIMSKIGAQMSHEKMTKTMMQYQKQSEMMNMKFDMMDEALIDEFDGAEAEEDQVIDQVLAEVGLDYEAMLAGAYAPTTKLPTSSAPVPQTSEKKKQQLTDEEKQLLAELDRL